MSSAEEDYREADRVVRSVEEDNRRRQDIREVERERLQRLHDQEAAHDRDLSQHAHAMRIVRHHRLLQEPSRMRRFLIRLTVAFVAIATVGAALVGIYAADLVVQQGLSAWIGYGAGTGYVLVFLGALIWHAHSCWSTDARTRVPATGAGLLMGLPAPFLLAAAWAGWANWLGALVILAVFLILAAPGIGTCRELSRQYRQILAAKNRGEH